MSFGNSCRGWSVLLMCREKIVAAAYTLRPRDLIYHCALRFITADHYTLTTALSVGYSWLAFPVWEMKWPQVLIQHACKIAFLYLVSAGPCLSFSIPVTVSWSNTPCQLKTKTFQCLLNCKDTQSLPVVTVLTEPIPYILSVFGFINGSVCSCCFVLVAPLNRVVL